MLQRYFIFLLLIYATAGSRPLYAQGENFKDYILRKGENLQQKTNSNIFVWVTTNKTSCYVGEPLIVTYKLCTRLGNVSNIVKNPSFNGFSVIDLAEPEIGLSNTIEVLNGRAYYTSVIRKAQLYPLQPGIAQLGQAIIESKLRYTKEEYIAQFDEFGKPEFIAGATTETACLDTTALIRNEPVSISVKPLPANNQPSSFNGAVGTYMIDALVEKDSFTTDEAAKLRVLLSGEGNMTLVPVPEVQFPAGLEAYEPTSKDGLNRLVVPVSGSKIFEYTFTAAKAGDYIISPIVFSYFDIDSGRYKSVSTKPVRIHVLKGSGKPPVIAAAKLDKPESFDQMMFKNRWMIIVPVALLIGIGLLVWLWFDKKLQNRKMRPPGITATDAVEEARLLFNPLLQAELELMRNEPAKFYEALDKELHVFLTRKFNIPLESISKKNIADVLDKAGVDLADSFALLQLMDEIAMQLYTPFTKETNMQEHYVEAVRLTKKL